MARRLGPPTCGAVGLGLVGGSGGPEEAGQLTRARDDGEIVWLASRTHRAVHAIEALLSTVCDSEDVVGLSDLTVGECCSQKFLRQIDAAVPAELDVHLILDNYTTHKTKIVQRWLLAHPRFHLHFTPTGASWLNLVERWFAELTNKKLRRGAHRSVRELNTDIRSWIEHWNENPRPYVWTKTADQILDSLTTRTLVP